MDFTCADRIRSRMARSEVYCSGGPGLDTPNGSAPRKCQQRVEGIWITLRGANLFVKVRGQSQYGCFSLPESVGSRQCGLMNGCRVRNERGKKREEMSEKCG